MIFKHLYSIPLIFLFIKSIVLFILGEEDAAIIWGGCTIFLAVASIMMDRWLK